MVQKESIISSSGSYTSNDIDTSIKTLQRSTRCDSTLQEITQLAEHLYKTMYPETFGGFFTPLSPTVGFTHCHYIQAEKFDTFDKNTFWIKCNLYTNAIEDMPPYLQPQSLREMIHMLYHITLWQNTYSNAHIVPTTFSDTASMQTGTFAIIDEALVIIWNIDTVAYMQENDSSILETHQHDVLLKDWSIVPSWEHAKKDVAIFLNTRGHEALMEIWEKEQGLPSLQKYFIRNSPSISLGSHTFNLKNIYSNIHMTRGIMRLHNATGKSWHDTIGLYTNHLTEYRNQTEDFDRVFFIGHIGTHEDDKAFEDFTGPRRQAIRDKYSGSFFDYTPDMYPSPRPLPRAIIDYIEVRIQDHPNEKILLSLGLHGETDGSALYDQTTFLKEDFNRLFQLARLYPSLQLFIVSCRSAQKTDKLHGNIIMSSSDQVSYGYYIKDFTQRYTQGYTLYQSHILTSHQYHKSLLPTSFINTNGRSIELCGLSNTRMHKPQPYTS